MRLCTAGERVQSNETLTLPMPTNVSKPIKLKLDKKFNEIITLIQNDFDFIKAKSVETEIDKIVLDDILELSKEEKWIIDDLVDYSIDLLENKERSKALYPILQEQTREYSKIIHKELNDFLDGQGVYANITTFRINPSNPLMMVKVSHDTLKKNTETSQVNLDAELQKIDQFLWSQKAQNIYFRRKLNYKVDNNIYLIRPNQRRFWSKSMALEDAAELILEILTGN